MRALVAVGPLNKGGDGEAGISSKSSSKRYQYSSDNGIEIDA